MVKNSVKSFVRENRFHSYLTRKTLPVEEKVSIFDDHEKTPSYQTFANRPMRKFVLMQCRAQGHFSSLSAVYSPKNDLRENRLIQFLTRG